MWVSGRQVTSNKTAFHYYYEARPNRLRPLSLFYLVRRGVWGSPPWTWPPDHGHLIPWPNTPSPKTMDYLTPQMQPPPLPYGQWTTWLHCEQKERYNWRHYLVGLPCVREMSGKNKIFSKSGKSQGILKKCQGILTISPMSGNCQGILWCHVREFYYDIIFRLKLPSYKGSTWVVFM